MIAVYSDQPPDFQAPAVFLAGPTPRKDGVVSWRPEALRLFHELGFAGTILIPEREHADSRYDYLEQVEWEYVGLEGADALLFWVPRDGEDLPGFTTNVEFGRYVGSGRMVYGRPDGRPHNRYLDWLYTKVTGNTPQLTLADTVQAAIALAESRHRS